MTVTRPHRLSHVSHGSQHLSMPVAINLLETPFTGWLGVMPLSGALPTTHPDPDPDPDWLLSC